jgi:hypothetical protein
MTEVPERGAGSSLFVGREEVIEPVVDSLVARRGYGLRTAGTWGIGKSYLVDELVQRAAECEAEVFTPIRAGNYVPRANRTTESEADTLDYLRNFDSYIRLLTALIAGCESDELEGLDLALGSAQSAVASVRNGPVDYHPEIHAGGSITASDEAGIGNLFYEGSEPTLSIEATITHEVWALEKALSVAIDAAAGWRGAVLLIDEFEQLDGYLVGDWLLKLVTSLRNAVVVIAARGSVANIAGAQDFNPLDLRPFDDAEVRAYLTGRLGAAATTPTLVDRVLEFSKGLPQAVAMAADLVEQRRDLGGAEDLGDVQFDASTPATTTLLSEIVGDLSKSDDVASKDVAKILREARVARRLDEDLIHHLVFRKPYADGSPDEQQRASHALNALVAYSFVEEVTGAAQDRLGRFRFHEYIRRAQPPPGDPELRINEEHVHERLAAYYEQRLADYDDAQTDNGAYLRWYKYEQLEWQRLTMEWLHHSGRLQRPDAREAARLEFARTVLSAFWWWGCYVDFDFCEQLIKDWERTQPSSERQWSASLRSILAHYPRGYVKLGAGDWEEVARALKQLRAGAGLARDNGLGRVSDGDPGARRHALTRRYTHALVTLLLAHSYRYRPGMGDIAIPLFNEAIDAFSPVDSAAVAWTTFELAEFTAELGDFGGAVAGLAKAAQLAIEDEDLELLANLHRLHGDIGWATDGDVETIVESTARAVLRSYAFLIEPNPPDLYTVTFYEEMRERAAGRLIAIGERAGPEAAGDAADLLARRLVALGTVTEPAAAGAIARGESPTVAELMSELMPPPPIVGLAALDDERFYVSARRVLAAVRTDPSDAALAKLATS